MKYDLPEAGPMKMVQFVQPSQKTVSVRSKTKTLQSWKQVIQRSLRDTDPAVLNLELLPVN